MNLRKALIKKERMRLVVTDFITANLAFFIFDILRAISAGIPDMDAESIRNFLCWPKICIEQFVFPILVLGIYWLTGFYNRPFDKSRMSELLNAALSACLSTILIFLSLLTDDQMPNPSTNWLSILWLFLIFFILTYAGRLIVIQSQIRQFKSGKWTEHVVIIGNSKKAHQIADQLRNGKSTRRHRIEGFFTIPGEQQAEHEALPLDKVQDYCTQKSIDQIILVPESLDEQKILGLLYQLFPLDIPVRLAPDTLNFISSSIRLEDIYGHPFVDLTHSSMNDASINIKRMFDVVGSITTLIILSPIFALLALWVKFDSPGPIFYRQKRIGLRQKEFDIIKFRTMSVDAEKDGPSLSDDDDPRVTKAGKVMRKYRLDELPQFWNVVKGEMSIVGPRPEREFFIKKIMKLAPYYTLLFQTRPGITSWGMVQYGYASKVEQMVERSKYDLIYISNMSILVDFKIMLYTVLTILEGRGK